MAVLELFVITLVKNVTTANMFLYSNQNKITISIFVVTQICPDIENSKHFTKQMFFILQYGRLSGMLTSLPAIAFAKDMLQVCLKGY